MNERRFLGAVTAILVALFISACPVTPEGPLLRVTPTTLDFGAASTVLNFAVSNGGSGTLNWQCACQAGWVGLSSSSGVNSGSVAVSVTRDTLGVGTHTADVVVTSDGGNATVHVSATVSGSPVIGLSTDVLDFAQVATTGTFSIYNLGSGALNWSASSYAPWVSLSSTSGANAAILTITINRSLLSPGANATTIQIASDGGNATLTVTAAGVPPSAALEITDVYPGKASVGDRVTLYGNGFSSTPANNTVDFNGGSTTATAFIPRSSSIDPDKLEVVVPAAATTGNVRVRVGAVWSNARTLEVVEATTITLAKGWETAGVFQPLVQVDEGQKYRQSWLFSGNNFTAVDVPWPAYTPSGLALEVDGVVYTHADIGGTLATSCYATALSDTLLAVPYVPDAVFESARKNGSLRVRIIGQEPGSPFLRYSNEITLSISDDPHIPGAYHPLTVHNFNTYPTSTDPDEPLQIPRGDYLYLAGRFADMQMRCPALWQGDIPFGPHGLFGRRFLMGAQGTFTITNLTNGTERVIEIKDEGVPDDNMLGGTFAFFETPSDSAIIGAGGTRLIVPPGALPLNEGHVAVGLRYTGGHASDNFDPEVSDGGLHCWVQFYRPDAPPSDDWSPPELLHPITLIVPFTLDGAESAPVLGCFDPDSGLYYTLPATIDYTTMKATIVFPAGVYPDATTVEKCPPSLEKAAQQLPPVSLNTITRRVGIPFYRTANATMTDPDNHFGLHYITDPSSSSYVSDAYAEELLNALVAAYDNLSSNLWREPPGTTAVHVREWSVFDGYGSTTKGVFGEPYVCINKGRCPQGSTALHTTAAHEVAHVFQRQYTTNVLAKWFDEAAADYVAFDTVGSGQFMTEALNDALPFIKTLPNSFNFGFTTEENYAASPWPIWLELEHPGTVRWIYEEVGEDWGYWTDSYGTFAEAAGENMTTLYREFAEAYWLQSFAPLAIVLFDDMITAETGVSPRLAMSSYGALQTPNRTHPSMSSIRYTMTIEPGFAATNNGRDIVVRTTGLTQVLPQVLVFSDTGPPNLPPMAPLKITTLDYETTSALLGQVAPGKSYRVIVINPQVSSTTQVRAALTIPNISGMSQSSGSRAGGYSVTLYGSGLGAQIGRILMSGSEVPITDWRDDRVTFTMPSVGATGAWQINARTAEDAATNSVTFTFTQ